MTCNEYLKLSPSELASKLTETFIIDIPLTINNVDEMNDISALIGMSINQYSFLVQLYCLAKVQTRSLKRLGKEAKVEYEDSVDRKEIIKYVLDAVLLRYKALSRMITIKQEVNNELNMSDVR